MRASDRLTAARRGPAGIAIPTFIIILLGIDLALAIAYAGHFVLGNPSTTLRHFLDLDGEEDLSTWYASVQWFCVGAVFWVFAERNVVRVHIRSWLLVLLPVIFLAFSLDEVAGIHEFLGHESDALFPSGRRDATPFSTTGLWFLAIGIPFVILFAALAVWLRPLLAGSRRAAKLFLVGMSLFLLAAVGVEALSNFVTSGSFAGMIQVVVEELTEMIAATLVLWSGYELLRDPPRPQSDVEAGLRGGVAPGSEEPPRGGAWT